MYSIRKVASEALSQGTTSRAHPGLEDWRYALGVVAVVRGLFLVLAYGAHWYFSSTTGPPRGLALEVWTHWDANILLGIATDGYTSASSDPHATAFFPLFPLLVRALARSGIPALPAALVVNSIASVVAFAYLSHLARRDLGSAEAGRRAVLYLAFFPTAVFLVAPYTEAVFLAGAVASFSYARSNHWGQIAVPAAVAVGARAVGVFVLAGLAVEFLRQKDFRWRKVRVAAVALAAGTLPLLLYAGFLWRVKGDPLYFLVDQRLGWYREFVGPVQSFRTTVGSSRWAGLPTSFVVAMRIEVLAALVGVAFTLWALKRRELGYATFMGLTMALLMTSTWYYSVPRALLSLFPIPVLLASFTDRGRYRHDMVMAACVSVASFGVIAFARRAWFF